MIKQVAKAPIQAICFKILFSRSTPRKHMLSFKDLRVTPFCRAFPLQIFCFDDAVIVKAHRQTFSRFQYSALCFGRGLDGVKLIVGDKCLGMLEAVGEVFPEAKYQRCTVHFYRNVFSVTPRSKVKLVAKMLKAVHAQESKKAAREKAKAVVEELRSMKLKEAAKKVEDGIEETLTYCDFPSEHWTRIRTNNVIERLSREIRRRTRVVGSFPDGNSALMLVCARLRHVAGTQWGNKKYMNMKHLEAALEDASIAG